MFRRRCKNKLKSHVFNYLITCVFSQKCTTFSGSIKTFIFVDFLQILFVEPEFLASLSKVFSYIVWEINVSEFFDYKNTTELSDSLEFCVLLPTMVCYICFGKKSENLSYHSSSSLHLLSACWWMDMDHCT